jgi:hypothetical protein
VLYLNAERCSHVASLLGSPGEGGVVSKGFRATAVGCGMASVISVVLRLLEKHGNLPLRVVYPNQRSPGRWVYVSTTVASMGTKA